MNLKLFVCRFLPLLQSLFSTASVVASYFLFCPAGFAQPGAPVWTNRFNGPANSFDTAVAVAVDSNGNAFVTGTSVGSGTASDYATIKYSSGGVPLWTNRYNGPASGEDYPTALAVDAGGNVYVTGSSAGNGSASDYATIKYSSTGALLWVRRYNGPGNRSDGATAMALDAQGKVFVTGDSYHDGNITEYTTIAYTSAGVPLWTNRYAYLPGFGEDHATALAVDGSGNVYVTGYSLGWTGTDYATVAYSNTGMALWTNRYEGPDSANEFANAMAVHSNGTIFVTGNDYSGPGGDDYATVAYSRAGALLWTNRFDGPLHYPDRARAVTLDRSNNVVVTGASEGYLTIKYSLAGVPLWTNNFSGPNPGDEASALGVDRHGNVFVTGRAWNVGSGTHYEYATVAYRSDGTQRWVQRFRATGTSSDQAVALTVDRSGNVYVTGSSYNTAGVTDYVTIKYQTSIPPARLNFTYVGNRLVLSWADSGYKLQSAPAVNGSYTDVPGAGSPYTVPIAAQKQFFRLKEI